MIVRSSIFYLLYRWAGEFGYWITDDFGNSVQVEPSINPADFWEYYE
jgi:hypothetical protein